MKEYILEAANGFDKALEGQVRGVVEAAGGEVVKFRHGSYLMLVRVSDDAVQEIKKINGISSVSENQKRKIPRSGVKPPGM